MFLRKVDDAVLAQSEDMANSLDELAAHFPNDVVQHTHTATPLGVCHWSTTHLSAFVEVCSSGVSYMDQRYSRADVRLPGGGVGFSILKRCVNMIHDSSIVVSLAGLKSRKT